MADVSGLPIDVIVSAAPYRKLSELYRLATISGVRYLAVTGSTTPTGRAFSGQIYDVVIGVGPEILRLSAHAATDGSKCSQLRCRICCSKVIWFSPCVASAEAGHRGDASLTKVEAFDGTSVSDTSASAPAGDPPVLVVGVQVAHLVWTAAAMEKPPQRLTQAMIINDLSRHSRLRIGALAPCA